MTTYGQRWRQAREEAGLSAADAASAAEVHENTIYNLEKEGPKEVDGITLRVMKNVAAVYGVTLGHIFRDDHEPERVPSELRPLLAPLALLGPQQREAIVRNIAANLTFFATLYREHAGSISAPSVTPSIRTEQTDEGTDPLSDR